ncbi:MAG: 4-hydroxythreonine-4-phosphate dehydrogenase PdxA [Alphaproteobacteria bacterium]
MTAAPLALTMGEPAGVGGEIALKAWAAQRGDRQIPAFFIIDDLNRLQGLANSIGLDVPLAEIDAPGEAADTFADALPVLHRPLPKDSTPGVVDPDNAEAVIASIETAVALTQGGEAAAVVTNPIHKKALYDAGFTFPGHTEFLAALAKIETPPVMMLACPGLRVVPVTVHVSLAEAINTLCSGDIVDIAKITARGLQRYFGIDKPRLAVAGLNPHAGEGGPMGTEEQTIIAPAIAELQGLGIDAVGPCPPDTLFHSSAREEYDAAICMYHDQALIPIKTLDFENAVNVTLGLPFVRTSPDHGTAFDIAGTGKANESSLLAALRMARDMTRRRDA